MYTIQKITEYFDQAKIVYQDVWHLDTCLAMHLGFWDSKVRSLKQALIRENEVLAEIANVKSTDKVLDAGCGVGGSAIYLSKHFNCYTYGITLSEKQVETAQQAAEAQGVSQKAQFSVGDFHQTSFDDSSFDVIWMTESFCHAVDSNQVMEEMFRLLKPNGRIIIADVFLSDREVNDRDNRIMSQWLNSWAVNSVESLLSIKDIMKSVGFQNLQTFNYTRQTSRSIWRLYLLGKVALTIGKFKRLLGKSYGNSFTIQTTHGAVLGYKTLKRKIWEYHVIQAIKPA